MNTRFAIQALALLRRTVFLTGLLGIIAGILGMHIMAEDHALPSAPNGHHATASQISQTSHAMPAEHSQHAEAHGPSITNPGQNLTQTVKASCSDGCGCATMSAMGGACVPSPGTTVLLAPSPGDAALPFGSANGLATPFSRYPYIPLGPSPGQLSISRT